MEVDLMRNVRERKNGNKRRKRKPKKAEKAEKKSGEPKEKRTKKKKLTRLPGQPKKNQSAYFLWMNHNREQIKKDYPGLSMTDMTKKAGELWRDLQDKTEWNNKAEEDKKRYEREFTKWKSEGGEEALKAAKKQAKKEKRASEGKTTAKSAKPKPDIAKTLSSAGTGTSYKSKEYIESSEDSSS